VIQINLPGLPKRSRPTGERISLRQLQNPPSKNAIKAFIEGLRYSEAGQFEKAATALEKAVQLSPAFADAHTNLGAQYLRLRRYEQAIEEAQRAMEAGSPNIHDLCNRGLAEWALGRPADAMRSAEQALRLDSRAIAANYIVGSLMSLNPETLPIAIRHLEIAAEKSPSAARNLVQARQLLAGR
jgi:tetratricopeptide (TPR) repeat protein